MSVIGSNVLAGASGQSAGGGGGGAAISRSLRFNSGDSAFLSRTPSAAGNRKTWTWSGWVKRTNIAGNAYLLGAGPSNSDYATFGILSSNHIFFQNNASGGNQINATSTSLLRDPSAWYHIVLVVDTTQATNSNGVKVYVNGTQHALTFSTYTQNTDTLINSTAAQLIGDYANNGGVYIDGYLADVHFIDGQALAPTDFGETNSNNLWVPKAYAGAYFTGVSNATGAVPIYNTTDAFGLVKGTGTRADSNSSYIVLALSMDGANNATVFADQSAIIKGSGSAKTITVGGDAHTSTDKSKFYGSSAELDGSGDSLAAAAGVDFAFGTGNFTVEVWINPDDHADYRTIIDNRQSGVNVATGYIIGQRSDGKIYVYINGSFTHISTSSLPVGVWSHIAYVRSGTTLTLYINGIAEASETASRTFSDNKFTIGKESYSGAGSQHQFNGYIQDVRAYKGVAKYTANFTVSQSSSNSFHLDFADNSNNAALGTDTSGVSPANTWTVNNLTASAPGLATANQGMDVVTWTGNGSDRDIGGLAFQPDFVWIKKRNSSSYGDHMLYDVVRGATKVLRSDNTAAEITDATTLDAFNSDGFSIGGGWEVNKSGDTYVSWAWKAGGAASSNTDGTITSSVSANNTYGFSIVSFTDGGSACTVGHGLSSAPKMIWAKFRGATGNWSVYHEATGNDHRLKLNLADAKQSGNDWWNATSPTSSVFSLGSNLVASTTQIAYCWSEIIGFSKFGSYTGGTNPKTITTGFKPAYLLIKRIDGSNQWVVIDSKRGGTKKLSPNLTVIENDGTYLGGDSANTVEFLSDGFKLTSTNAETNGSGQTHIYAAFASKPSGEGVDSLVDTPTNGTASTGGDPGGVTVGNYATFNPLDKTSGITLSDGNLKATGQANGSDRVRGTIAIPRSGKWYFEFTLGSAFYGYIGISNIDGTKLVGRNEDGRKYTEAGHVSTPFASITAGDIVGVALDNNTTLTFYKNGVAESTTVTVDSNTDYFAMANFYNAIYILNSGQRAFAYTAPSGYKSLNTANLAEPTIADGSKYFDTKLYTGTGSALTISNYGFSPDLAWIKCRNATLGHNLVDTVRGANYTLFSNTTGAESTQTDRLTAFTSDGFTLGTNAAVNTSSNTHVAWAWDAGSSTVSNTDGSISAQVRANQSAGFSIVSYTGTQTQAGNGTIGHGLNAQTALVISKDRGNASPWIVQHTSLGDNEYLILNTTDAANNSSSVGGGALPKPTSSVFYGSWLTGLNTNGANFIAYCFAPVEGYSAFGSYTGNGSADGVFVHTGFKIAYLVIKCTSHTSMWSCWDTARDVDNFSEHRLRLDQSNAEESGDSNIYIDLLSNGFKTRAADTDTNGSGRTYVYIAFASHPFASNGGLAR